MAYRPRETSHQLIVYHPPSHAIQVVPHPDRSRARSHETTEHTDPIQLATPDSLPVEVVAHSSSGCPLCGRPWGASSPGSPDRREEVLPDQQGQGHYFRVLEMAHESSRPGTPLPANDDISFTSSPHASPGNHNDSIEDSDLPARGYYHRFFKEDSRLGIGAEGSVYLATHVISGNELGQSNTPQCLTFQEHTPSRRLRWAAPRPTWFECCEKCGYWNPCVIRTSYPIITPGLMRRGSRPLGRQSLLFMFS